MRGFLFFTGVALFLGWMTTRIVLGIQLNQQFTGHLKRAADANQIELAAQELGVAVKYLEDNNLTSGYTSIVWQTPDEDLGFFYTNLKSAHGELVQMSDTTVSNLESSNQLIKLRETLLDSGEKSDSITCPDGLSIYPYNTLFMIWLLFSLILMAGPGISFVVSDL
jgi:tetrahydromethanopterin S-methyltransferase subunit F